MFLTYPLDADYFPNFRQMFTFWLFSLNLRPVKSRPFFRMTGSVSRLKLLFFCQIIALDSRAAFPLKKAFFLFSFFRPFSALACKYIDNSGMKFEQNEKKLQIFSQKYTNIYSDVVRDKRYYLV